MVRIRYLAVVMGILVTVSLSMAQARGGKRLEKGEEGHQYKHQLVSISGYVQPRWEATLAGDSLLNTFGIRRAYFGGSGDVGKCFSYRVLLTLTERPAPFIVALYDAYVDVKPSKLLSIRVGQFQTPIGMEKLVSSSKILFPERSYASGFAIDRDLGMMLASKVKFIGAQVGVFNGVGRNIRKDDNEAKDIVGRLTLKPIEWVHVGGAYLMGTRTSVDIVDTTLTVTDWPLSRWGAELALTPWNLRLAAEFMGGQDDTLSLMTYYAEAGWMFKLPCKWMYGIQPAARYEGFDPNTASDGDAESIITAGVNLHFLPKHRAKLALCYRMITEEQGEVNNDQIIAQLQLKF